MVKKIKINVAKPMYVITEKMQERDEPEPDLLTVGK